MDAERFDRVTKSLASKRTRRGFAGLIATAAVGVLPVAARAAAQRRADGVACSKNADCESGYCAPKTATGRRACAAAGPCAGFSGPEGSMTCAGTGFCTIAQGVGVYRDCAAGTTCVPDSQSQIICDWPVS
jgi:hypothetical protein